MTPEPEVLRLLHLYLDGELPAPERATLARLLAEDSPESREALRLLDAHLLMGVLLGRQAGPEAMAERVLAQLPPQEPADVDVRRFQPPVAAPWPRRWRLALPLAAAASLLLAAGIWRMAGGRSSVAGGRSSVSGGQVVVRVVAKKSEVRSQPPSPGGHGVPGKAGGAWVELAVGDEVPAGTRIETGKDGAVTLAWVGEATTLELGGDSGFRVQSSGKSQRLDRGRLAATVAKQKPGQPFVIETPHARATVIGTRLLVRASPAETEVDVAEGLVQVDSLSSQASGKIAAGQSAIFRAEQREIVVLGETLLLEEFDNGLGAWNVAGSDEKGQPRPVTEADRRAVSIQAMERDGKTVNCAVIDATGAGGQWISLDSKNPISATSVWQTVSYKAIRTAPRGEIRAIVGANADRGPVRREIRRVKNAPSTGGQWLEHQGESRITVEDNGQFSLLSRTSVNGKPIGDMITYYDGQTPPRLVASATAVGVEMAVDRVEIRRLISIIQPPAARP